VSESDLHRALQAEEAPDEPQAEERAWAVVRRAHAEREPTQAAPRRPRPALALAVAIVLVLVAAAFTPPGRAVGDWLRDRVAGREPSEPALARVPGGGRLLVVSERGAWAVRSDGSKRLLGAYENASWSPQGLFVVVTRGRRVLALEPDGDPRWSLTRPDMVAQARWAPSGFRVAYRAGASLRVVAGDGSGDRLLARAIQPVAPAWLPGGRNVLAYVDGDGRVHVANVDTGRELWRSPSLQRVRQLEWSGGGRRLLVVAPDRIQLFTRSGRRLPRAIEPPANRVIGRVALAPNRRAFAYTELDREAGRSAVVLVRGVRQRARTLFAGAGSFGELAWSPGGRWLLATWPSADQWLFLRMPGVGRVVAVSGIGREFDPGAESDSPFPRVTGWCCARASG
jgi:hypothetical protein